MGLLAGRTALVVVVSVAVVVACGHAGVPAPQATASSKGKPTAQKAQPVAPNPAVGAVFLGGGTLHTCTGAVLHSAGGDLILTAAHCLAEGFEADFVPGFAQKADPENTWKIEAVYLDPRWLFAKDPVADYAIARVGRAGGGSIESRTGSVLTLASAPQRGATVAVTGYPLGAGGGPIGCQGRTGLTDGGYPSLACSGLVDGTSGAPWITGSSVVGLIGGLDGGGCEDAVSYSPPFDDQITRLLDRAEAGGPADAAPNTFQDNC
ncbi:MAG: trypsin [Mycobacterium sp.]|nr:trypsin [Mycobacterium sp.]